MRFNAPCEFINSTGSFAVMSDHLFIYLFFWLLSRRSRSRGRARADDEDSMDAMDATLPPEMGEKGEKNIFSISIC